MPYSKGLVVGDFLHDEKEAILSPSLLNGNPTMIESVFHAPFCLN